MNIYDEAIQLEIEIKENRLQLTKEKYRDLNDIKLSKIIKSKSDKHDKIIQALERAKKEHELLGLYKELSIVRFYLFSETDADLGQELMNKDDNLNKQIKQLEDEMK